ncbi:unnamed protein product [Rhizophagus irregularis]|nr:unnamed protein product [Rhizophagus irregularis]
MKNLITETIDKLIDLLIQNGVDAKKIIKEDLIDLPMFQRAKDTNEFCFIDMIKGIFPLSLSRIILFFIGVSKEKLARMIGIEILNFIFTKVNSSVWKRRCEAMKQTEKSLGISKMDKKKTDSIFTKENEKELQSKRYLGNYPLFEGLISIKEHILFGKEILGFMGNVQRIGAGGFGKVYRVNWKNSDQYLALKSFSNVDDVIAKEIVHELKLQRDIQFHNNIIKFYGVAQFEPASAVACLHNEGIVHRDLHSGNVGQPPFATEEYDIDLALEISQGRREEPIPNTPENYITIYTECWDNEPDNRPTMNQMNKILIQSIQSILLLQI